MVAALAAPGRDEDRPARGRQGARAWSRGASSSARPSRWPSGSGFVPVRKAGKLPRATYSVSYELEYGEATLELHRDAVQPGDRVLLVDDVLATGGTARATADLVEKCGGTVHGLAVLMDLGFLPGRATIGAVPLTSLMTV